jgi:spore coat polysaccharide biosynthesis predicted glycosyltransferase SpsG
MIGFCIEASHARGLGHLYRTLNFIEYLAGQGQRCLVMMNADTRAAALLDQHSLQHVTVDLANLSSDWESALIARFKLTVWINDRLDTTLNHAQNVRKNAVRLVTFDDRGPGAALADLHCAPLIFSGQETLRGKRVLTGVKYLPLNQEIDRYRRVRTRLDSPLLVTLGGSDTYGVTVRVVALLKRLKQRATVIVGPAFRHEAELEAVLDESFTVKRGVPSLIQEFSHHDLAVTGGGITPFEANASGLPCIIVANEPHEVETGQHLAGLGSSVFAGYYQDISEKVFARQLDLVAMSRAGLEHIDTRGVENIFREIAAL